MAQYFELPLETDKSGPLNLPENMHPMLEKCVEILEPMFIEDIITKEGMGLLANPKQWVALLQVGERSQPRATAGSEAASIATHFYTNLSTSLYFIYFCSLAALPNR